MVIGLEGRRMVVQLEGPPAERTARLVLFHGQSSENMEIRIQTKVLVWAWTRQLGGGAQKFLEGVAAVVKLEDIAAIEKVEDAAEAVAGQAAYVGQHGQNNRQLLRRLLYFECLNAACLGKCQELLNFILLLSSNFYARPRYKA